MVKTDAPPEQPRQALALLAASGHDLRGPLHTVLGLTELLLDTELSPDQRQYVEGIRASGDAVLAQLGDMLDLARIECATFELTRQPFDPSEMCAAALQLAARGGGGSPPDLVLTIAEQTPDAIVGDGARVRQILTRLIALQAPRGAGEIVVQIGSRQVANGRHEVQFTVSRTAGAPATRHPVERAGVQVALALVQRLTAAMGGVLWLEGDADRNPAYHFTMTSDAVPADRPPHRRGVHATLEGRRLLIADDSTGKRDLLFHLTRSWGMSPRVAASAAEALGWIAGGQAFDAAVLDAELRTADDQPILPAVRRLRDAASLPAVLVTPTPAWTADRRHVAASGDAAATLSQPVLPAVLFHALIQLFPEHEARAERPADPSRGAAQARRVLLVDDSPLNQKVAERILQHLGCKVEMAADGSTVLDVLKTERYDAVFMDIEMPGLDGLATTRQIRERWPAWQQPHIVAMTAHDSPAVRERCKAAGMNDYLDKTAAFDAWLAVLRRAPRATRDNE